MSRDATVLAPEIGHDAPRIVRRHAVGDENFDPLRRVVLCQHRTHTAVDERRFIAHGHQHRNVWDVGHGDVGWRGVGRQLTGVELTGSIAAGCRVRMNAK